MDLSGAQLFGRFAYPPNALGYCGPDQPENLRHLAVVEPTRELLHLAREFEGAHPYLRLIAGANGRTDALDHDVVEAYWIGNQLLSHVGPHDFGVSIDDRFRHRAGRAWGRLATSVPHGCANHAFHVLVASPWVGLLRQGVVDEPLRVMDDCRISWGRVVAKQDHVLVVSRTPLVWTGSYPELRGSEVVSVETLVDAEVGDDVALHWGWACERLSPDRRGWLQGVTDQQLHALRVGLGVTEPAPMPGMRQVPAAT